MRRFSDLQKTTNVVVESIRELDIRASCVKDVVWKSRQQE